MEILLFSKGIKVYTIPLWPEGLMMANYALDEVVESQLFDVKEHIDYVSLPYKAGGSIVIRGIAKHIALEISFTEHCVSGGTAMLKSLFLLNVR